MQRGPAYHRIALIQLFGMWLVMAVVVLGVEPSGAAFDHAVHLAETDQTAGETLPKPAAYHDDCVIHSGCTMAGAIPDGSGGVEPQQARMTPLRLETVGEGGPSPPLRPPIFVSP